MISKPFKAGAGAVIGLVCGAIAKLACSAAMMGVFGMLAIALYQKGGAATIPLPIGEDGNPDYNMVVPVMLAKYFPNGMLGIGLMLFCLRGLGRTAVWDEKLLKGSFWAMNIGLALMALLSLLPHGLLQVHEVLGLRLNADLVTLSACETGLGKTAGGEGVLGLQRAFQVAGARTTITRLPRVTRPHDLLAEMEFRDPNGEARTVAAVIERLA